MIELQAKKHDNFSVEFKAGFIPGMNGRKERMSINMWIFVPNSLDINADTYSKEQFYRDIKSNVRLITPVFLLRDIAGGLAIPLGNLENSFREVASDPSKARITDYEYEIKMFMAIFKSSLRDETAHIMNLAGNSDIEHKCSEYLYNISEIARSYRELRHIINVPTIPAERYDYFSFGDEFLSNTIEKQLFRLIMHLQKGDAGVCLVARLNEMVRRERAYRREAGFPVTEKESPDSNRSVVLRRGILKKYIESDLFLQARKKRDGVVREQFYFSIAAGLSMVFATAIAFSFQQRYGNFTMPLFVALVVSYMLKDRIKDTMRYFFAYRLKAKYFDNKTLIRLKDKRLGRIREGMDFITEDKVPDRVMELRSRTPLLKAENRISDEKIILYRKMVQLDSELLQDEERYSIEGINDIMRLYLTSFIMKTDNPEVPLYYIDSQERIRTIVGEKIYCLNIIVQLDHAPRTDYKRYRVSFSRNGIQELEELE